MHPQWGTLKPPELICHFIDTLRITFGETKPEFSPSFFSTRLGQRFVISSPFPWPKGKIKGLSDCWETKPKGEYEHDRNTLVEMMSRFGTGPDQSWGISPVFGRLAPEQWAVLNYRHTDHHLRQFRL